MTKKIILDPRSSSFVGGRSINLALSNRGRRALREVGLEEEIISSGVSMKGRLIHTTSGYQKSILYDGRTSQVQFNYYLLYNYVNCCFSVFTPFRENF